MIYESTPWKQDLQKCKNQIIKYNTAKHFAKDDDATYTAIEKAIFYSAFIIRKLMDCKPKLSDDACSYKLSVYAIHCNKQFNLLHRWPDEDSHDWENEDSINYYGRCVCNWLIHSYIFFLIHNEDNTVNSFCVASDNDKNKILYRITMEEWIKFIDYVATDDIAEMIMLKNPKNGDYDIYKKRERSPLCSSDLLRFLREFKNEEKTEK